jgi:hypothetical protein
VASFVRAAAGADSANSLDDHMLRDVGLWRDRDGQIRALNGSEWR